MESYGLISGIVYGAGGGTTSTVPGARVFAERLGGGFATFEYADQAGHYEIEIPSSGLYYVHTVAPDWSRVLLGLDVDTQFFHQDFILPPAGIICGHILYGSGTPVPPWGKTIVPGSGYVVAWQGEEPYDQYETEEFGGEYFVISGVTAARSTLQVLPVSGTLYALEANMEGYSQSQVFDVQVYPYNGPGSEAQVTIPVYPQGGIQGWVVQGDGPFSGEPVTNAWATASLDDKPSDQFELADAEGYFLLGGLDPGSYTLSVGADDWSVGEWSGITVSPGQGTNVGEVGLFSLATVIGRTVNDQNQPLPDTDIEVEEWEYSRFSSDDAGYFGIEKLTAPASYHLVFMYGDEELFAAQYVEVMPGDVIDLGDIILTTF